MYQQYKDRAGFVFVYIREAHPEDGWQLPDNVRDEVVLADPKTLKERKSVARACTQRLNLTMPVVVDTIDDRVDNLYAGWPERMFVIDAKGRIAYAGQRGPWGFKPEEVEASLKKLLEGK